MNAEFKKKGKIFFFFNFHIAISAVDFFSGIIYNVLNSVKIKKKIK